MQICRSRGGAWCYSERHKAVGFDMYNHVASLASDREYSVGFRLCTIEKADG